MMEMRELCHVNKNIVSPQANKPVIGIVQDALVGAYLLTQDSMIFTREEFFQLVMQTQVDIPKMEDTLKRAQKFKKYRKHPYCGKTLLSVILPSDFNYRKTTNVDPNDPEVRIKNGVMYKGRLCKKTLGAKANSIIQLIWREYSPDEAGKFISRLQWLANSFLLIHGFSVGLKDAMVPVGTAVQEAITKAEMEAQAIQQNEEDKVQEMKINAALNKAKDIGEKLCKEVLVGEYSSNALKLMIESGSKGNFINFSQICSLLGQQNVGGQRIAKTISGYRRTLPMFEENEQTPESRGFVKSSFLDGLKPWEYWFHSCGGREGLVDTAIKTADSGYIQRRMIKSLEDCKVEYDRTVRNSKGTIIQFAYGDDGMDGGKLVMVDSKPQFMNVSRLAERLNRKYKKK